MKQAAGWMSSLLIVLALLPPAALNAQAPAAHATIPNAQLQYVVILSRHGVRPPLTQPDALQQYSNGPWPQWEVQPGYLTPHGYQLMKLFGAWDRQRFSVDGLFRATGCGDAARVSIFADSDERTRETGKALAEGMFPDCSIDVHAKAEGVTDPLFSAINDLHPDAALAAAAISGRIGANPEGLTEAYRPQLIALDRVLSGCGKITTKNPKRISLLDMPSSLDASSTRIDPLRGPLSLTTTLAENLLLEYADGKPDAEVGWGCVDEPTLREVMQLSEASWDYRYRTPVIARMYASNLLSHIERSMEQKVSGKSLPGAVGSPTDSALILVGHDTNLVTVAGALGIDWIVDGRTDDTPPGGALLFELWKPMSGGEPFVRVEYTAQTLDQMRNAQPLTPVNPPVQAPIFVPGCSHADMSCSWDGFAAAMRAATDPAYVNEK